MTPMLVKQLQTNVLRKRGIAAKPEEILITIGTQNSLYLLASLLANEQTKIGIEEPGISGCEEHFLLSWRGDHSPAD